MKIPKELYVVAQNALPGELPLGFLHGYEPQSKAFAAKKETMLQWAYTFNVSFPSINEVNGIFHYHQREYTINEAENKYETKDWLEVAENQPRIWANEPLEGFRILTTVSRYSTSNKLWRIADPRGIQFEITTGSIEKILEVGTVIKNEIVGKCVWVSNKNLQYVG